MESIVLTTERLYLRPLTEADWVPLTAILQDPIAMYAYEHAFSDEEARESLNKQLNRYRQDGFGLWAVVLKDTGEMVGECGLSWQEVNGEQLLEVGYLFQRAHWGKGYASEAAIACKCYAFDVIKADYVVSIIRENNAASQRVAQRNGMVPRDHVIKSYYGITMPHVVYGITREEYEAAKSVNA